MVHAGCGVVGRAYELCYGMGSNKMATILAADYGRDDFLALGSPLGSTLRAWGYEVVEAENSLDVLAQASRVHPDAVLLYDTLPIWRHCAPCYTNTLPLSIFLP